MSSTCPNCQAPVPDDFGLIECAKCGASIFVEFDGSVTAPTEEPVIEHHSNSQSNAIDFDQDETSFEFPAEVDAGSAAAVVAGEAEESFDIMPQSVIAEIPQSTTSEQHMDELQDFANSPLSQGRDGLLRVNLIISGIDTSDLRNLVYEALLDKKFLWDAESIMKGVASGQLQIPDLPSVKAAVLLLRLKNIPVNVSWEQHAIHQA